MVFEKRYEIGLKLVVTPSSSFGESLVACSKWINLSTRHLLEVEANVSK